MRPSCRRWRWSRPRSNLRQLLSGQRRPRQRGPRNRQKRKPSPRRRLRPPSRRNREGRANPRSRPRPKLPRKRERDKGEPEWPTKNQLEARETGGTAAVSGWGSSDSAASRSRPGRSLSVNGEPPSGPGSTSAAARTTRSTPASKESSVSRTKEAGGNSFPSCRHSGVGKTGFRILPKKRPNASTLLCLKEGRPRADVHRSSQSYAPGRQRGELLRQLPTGVGSPQGRSGRRPRRGRGGGVSGG